MTLPGTSQDSQAIKAGLEVALSRQCAGKVQVTALRRLTGGATKQTWLLDALMGGTPQRLVLQLTPPSKLQVPETVARALSEGIKPRSLAPEDDARFSQLARANGVPAPELVMMLEPADGLGPGLLTRWVAGETLGPRILRDERYAQARQSMGRQCAQALAGIHAIAPQQAHFLPRKSARYQWRENRALVDAHRLAVPALEWGLRWVEERLDEFADTEMLPVHGDFRLGNLMVDERGLCAVLDWELGAIADPMQDLAWLCLRTWRFGGSQPVAGIAGRQAFYEDYARFSGRPVDPRRVFFWEVFCQIRWAVMCLGMGMGQPGGDSSAVSLEHRLVGRRMEEPLWDMMRMLRERQLDA